MAGIHPSNFEIGLQNYVLLKSGGTSITTQNMKSVKTFVIWSSTSSNFVAIAFGKKMSLVVE